MDASLSQAVASAFLEAYRRCMDDIAADKSKHFMPFPAVVCAAFSAEVGLKTILIREGTAARGHDLLSLFMKVSDERKIKILEFTGVSIEEFASHLKHSKDGFAVWRYIYEAENEMHVNVGFLGKLATAIEKVGLSLNTTA